MADLSRLASSPYPLSLWVQVFGGPRKPGKIHVTPRRTIDRSHNHSGSIVYFPAGTLSEYEAVSAFIAASAREIVRRAENGTLYSL
jgi:hypothetical protein